MRKKITLVTGAGRVLVKKLQLNFLKMTFCLFYNLKKSQKHFKKKNSKYKKF